MKPGILGIGWEVPRDRADPDAGWRVATAEPGSVPPRLRRSGAIARHALAAARAAYRSAGVDPGPGDAIVFATTDGGIAHSKKFFSGLSADGCGSPLLFPETVYNAPCSHVAAVLGIGGPALTLVTDDGLSAVCEAARMVAGGFAARVLAIAANEADPMASMAHRHWRVVRSGTNPAGEGAAALLVGTGGMARVEKWESGPPVRTRAACREIFKSGFPAGALVAGSFSGPLGRAARRGLPGAAGVAFDASGVFGEAGAVGGAAAAVWLSGHLEAGGCGVVFSCGYAGGNSSLCLTGA